MTFKLNKADQITVVNPISNILWVMTPVKEVKNSGVELAIAKKKPPAKTEEIFNLYETAAKLSSTHCEGMFIKNNLLIIPIISNIIRL